jgi:hypothetical protein
LANEEQHRRETQSTGAFLSSKNYRVGLSASFLLWGCMLLLFFCLGQFNVWVKRDDLIALAQTTAAVASIAIAVLAYLHDVDSKDRFFRLFLAALTFVLLLGTLTGWLAALTMRPPVPPSTGPEFTGLALRFLVVGSIFFCTGVSGGLVVWRGAWPLLQVRFDYSFFSSPLVVFAAFAIWPVNASLAGITLALSIGAIVYLICFLIVLFFFVWRGTAEKSYHERIVERVLETLRSMRALGVTGNRAPAAVEIGELKSILHSNDTTLKSALDALLAEDRIFQVGSGYYALETADWENCLANLQKFNVVVFKKGAADELAKTLGLPSELVMSHLLPDALSKKYILVSDRQGSPVYLDPDVVTRAELASIVAEANKQPTHGRTKSDWRDDWIGERIRRTFKCLPNDIAPREISAPCKEYAKTNP